jgi:hypothetical protein
MKTSNYTPSEDARHVHAVSLAWKILVCCILALFAGVFVWLNARIAMSFAPWIDDVVQIDAAVNLYLGKGWVSSGWYNQSQYTFWAGNNPLYTLAVYCWISIFGFSAVIIRSLNYVLVLLIAVIVVDASRRLKLVNALWTQILLGILIIFDQSVAFVYRSGRADLITLLVLALLFWVYASVQSPVRRRTMLFLCALPLLASGIQAVPYVALLFVLEYLLTRRLRMADVAPIAIGGVTGGLLMGAIFFLNHSLKAYIIATFASSHTIIGSAAKTFIIRDKHSVGIFQDQMKDFSPIRATGYIVGEHSMMAICCFLLFLLGITLWSKGKLRLRQIALSGIIAAVLISYGMILTGHYSHYYQWMGAVPVFIIFAMSLEQCQIMRYRLVLLVGILAGVFSIILGMPKELWQQWGQPYSDEYKPVEQMLRQDTKAGDAIYGDHVFYYAARMQGFPFVSTTYATGLLYSRMTDEERTRITVMMVRPDEYAESVDKLGGRWEKIDSEKLPYGIEESVWRRATE